MEERVLITSCQEAWRDELDKLLAAIPLDFSEDPGEIAERNKALELVRNVIAKRWSYLLELKPKVPEVHFNIMVDRMKDTMTKLLEIHGTEIAFCPSPDGSLLGSPLQDQPKASETALGDSGASSTRCPSTQSNGSVVPHEFKFLRVLDAAGTPSVWTCLKVGDCKGSGMK